MVRWIVASSLKFRLLVLPLAVGLVALGITQIHKAPVDALPEFTRPVVEVQTESLGLSAPEVEQLITVPMEQDLLNGVMGVDTIRSSSVPGLSDVTMTFERGTDLFKARQLVQERLTQAHALPNVSKPPQMLQPLSSTSRAMIVGLSTDRLTPIQLSVLARWTVKPRLMGLTGVANVAIWGFRDRELQVLTDPAKLKAKGVTLSQVLRTTGNAQLVSPLTFVEASTPGTGGFIDGPNQRLSIRHIVPFGKPANLASVPVEGTNGTVRLADVGKVTEDHQPLIGDTVVGDRHGLLLVVQKLPGANTLDVTRRVQDALDEMAPGLRGVKVDTHVFRQASYIESALDNVRTMAIIGGALALLAVVAFFMAWRAVLVTVVALPLSLLTALLVLRLTDTSYNALVLVGLIVALGALIDDAVSDSQNLALRLRERADAGSETPLAKAILQGSLQIRRPLGYATVILLVAMVPVFFAGGTSGSFVHSLALAYGLAILASLLVALTVTPALTMVLNMRGAGRAGGPAGPWLARRWDGVLTRTIRSPRPALFVLGGFLLVGLAALPLMDEALRPTFKDRNLVVKWNATPSTSLPEMQRITARATRELEAIPGVEDAAAHVGRAITGDQAVGTGSGELWVTIDPKADYDKTARAVSSVVHGYPGISARMLTYEGDRAQEEGVLTPADKDLVVRVFGVDYGVLGRQAERIRKVVAGVDGVSSPRVISQAQQPTLQVEADIARARAHGLKPGDVRRAAGTIINGLEAGSFFEGQKVFAVTVRGVPSTRRSISDVRNLLINTPGGGHVRLGDVASVKITPNPVDIRHDAVERYMDVRAAVAGRSLEAVRSDVTDRLRAMKLPLEYSAEVQKPSEDITPPAGRLVALAIAAVIGIFLLLQAAFSSWRLATLVFFTAPAALVGGLLVILADGGDLSLGGLFGLFMVGGIAIRNAVVLVSRLQELRRTETGKSGPELVAQGVRERFTPIVMTAVVLALALAPFAIGGDIAGGEIAHATASVVLGGLVTATIVNLFLVPALYLHFGVADRAQRRRRTPAEAPPVPHVEVNA